jgi:hypothetical protein
MSSGLLEMWVAFPTRGTPLMVCPCLDSAVDDYGHAHHSAPVEFMSARRRR